MLADGAVFGRPQLLCNNYLGGCVIYYIAVISYEVSTRPAIHIPKLGQIIPPYISSGYMPLVVETVKPALANVLGYLLR